jgi:hypothetical protein
MIGTCKVCGISLGERSVPKGMCGACRKIRREARKKTVHATCLQCGKEYVAEGRTALAKIRRGRPTCSGSCADLAKREIFSKTMAETNKKHASARMKRKNPMHNDAIRESVSQRLREIGHKPKVLGGCGRGLTEPQRLLSEAMGWPTEVVVPTRLKPPFPRHYKIDVAEPSRMIAVEVDGPSHGSRKVQEADARKESFLAERGWRVFRFSNQEIMDNLQRVVEKLKCSTSA